MNQMSTTARTAFSSLGDTVVDVLVPLAILFFGWIIAVLVGRGVRKLLERTTFDERVGHLIAGGDVDSNRLFGRVAFWVVMLFVVAAFLTRLQLAVAAEPINAFLVSIFEFGPRVLGAAVLAFVAWVVAGVARRLIQAALSRTRLDDKIAGERRPFDQSAVPEAVTTDQLPIEEFERVERRPSQSIGEAAYWLVFLLFLPAILGVLGVGGLLRPVEGMVNEILGFLPNLVSAAIILAAGWFVARVIQRIVTSVLAAAGLDRLATRYGVNRTLGHRRLSEILGILVYVLVLLPVAVAALGALDIEVITRPASQMLTTILEAVPHIFGASLVLGISFFIGKFIAGLVVSVLASAGFDRILVRLGVATRPPEPGEMGPSRFIGIAVLTAIMLFAATEAANLLGFELLAVLVADVIVLAGRVALGMAIIGLGLFLGELAARALHASELGHAKLLARAARLAIILLAGAMGLRAMGLANEIITLAFGLGLGAVAVAVALAFGLGAREVAGSVAAEWRARWRAERQGP